LANGTSAVVDSIEAKLDLMASQLQYLQTQNANQTQQLQHLQEENANLTQIIQTNFQSQNQTLQSLLGKV
jgi:isochorismate synthase EntC